MRKKLEPEERPIYSVVTVYRERGNYLQRLEQFEKAILAYNEALRWNNSDIGSLLGRSLARAKATHYAGALEDAARAAQLEPENLTALQIKAKTEYEKCEFERTLVLAYRGQRLRLLPPNFADCVRCAEETVRECVGETAEKTLSSRTKQLQVIDMVYDTMDNVINVPKRKSRMLPQTTHQIQEISRVEKQKAEHISRVMASKYLEQMAHDKYFLTTLCKDERLYSANKLGAQKLQILANKALADVEKRQAVLRERRPLYAARAIEAAARARLSKARKQRIGHAQRQHATDARRLVTAAQDIYENHDTAKCLEAAEFGMEQISRIPSNMLPDKDVYLQQLHEIIAEAFLDQKRVRDEMSEADREKRAFILLGIPISREPSRDSILRTRPPAPPRDAKRRLRRLERALTVSGRASERCYALHEFGRLLADTKQAHRARFYALKCQSEARSTGQRVWLLNATFLLARCHILQNNRPESRAALIEGAGLARSFGYKDVAAFFDTCVDVSLEGEIGSSDSILEKREKAMVSLMQDDDMRKAAEHLFRRMSVIPASRRFSVMPGARAESAPSAAGRRVSIMPRTQQPVRIAHKSRHPLGFQDFDT
ncbi:outer dynein arm-docking complex subunit 4-like [Nymphalis io]|uniref:outer dynein arm-docking complex subunit 4-like n=1 Tax=Inachis io TaxID=171585 RepID=UPI0021671244|nr:outer dynein arm-docking complex subunit 4-like [Nymphalis io]